jgi:hypothetical protein
MRISGENMTVHATFAARYYQVQATWIQGYKNSKREGSLFSIHFSPYCRLECEYDRLKTNCG